MIGSYYIVALVATQFGLFYNSHLSVEAGYQASDHSGINRRSVSEELQHQVDSSSSNSASSASDRSQIPEEILALWSNLTAAMTNNDPTPTYDPSQCTQCRSRQRAKDMLVNKLRSHIMEAMDWGEAPNVTDEYVRSLKAAKLDNVFTAEFQSDQPVQSQEYHAEVKEIFLSSIEVPPRVGSVILDALKSRIIYFDIESTLDGKFDISEAILKIQLTEDLRRLMPFALAKYGVGEKMEIAIDMVVSEGSSVTFKTTKMIVDRQELIGGQINIPVSKQVNFWMKDLKMNNMGLQIRIKNENATKYLNKVFETYRLFSHVNSEDTKRHNQRLPILLLKVKKRNPASSNGVSPIENTECQRSHYGSGNKPNKCCAQLEKLVFRDLGMNFVVFPESVMAHTCIGPCNSLLQSEALSSGTVHSFMQRSKESGCCSPQRRRSLELIVYKDVETLQKVKLTNFLVSGCACQ